MKERLKDLIRGSSSSNEARNRTREILQAEVLGSLQRSGAMVPLAFQGGTALRFLYGIRRYSEDLDFALERPEGGYDFRRYLRSIQSDLSRSGYETEIRVSDQRTVHNAFLKFPGLLTELGLTPHRNEMFSIKVEVDTRPPAGAALMTTLIVSDVRPFLESPADVDLLTPESLDLVLGKA